MIFNGKNIQIGVNSKPIFAQSISVSAETPKEEFYLLLDRDPRSTYPTNVYQVTTSLNYYLTGVDPLKQFIKDETNRINLTIGQLTITSGVLESYNLSSDSQSFLNATATIKSYQNITGEITAASSQVANFNPLKWYNCIITGSGIDNRTLTGISSFDYSYNAEIIPRFYLQSETGLEYYTTSNVLFNKKKGNLRLAVDNIEIQQLADSNYLQLGIDFNDDFGNNFDRLYVYGNVVNKSTSVNANTNRQNNLSLIQTNIYEPPFIQEFLSDIEPDSIFSVIGSNFDNVTNVYLGNKECSIMSLSPSEIIAKSPADLISGSLKVKGFGGEDIKTNTTFSFVSPIIEGASVTTGYIGSYVTINGREFDTVDQLFFGEQSGYFDSYIGIYSDSIRAVVPDNFSSGLITVKSSRRNVSGVSDFNFKTPPQILSFFPQTGIPGTTLFVTGKSFYDVNSVTLNNITASYSVLSMSGISLTVPNGNTAGSIKLTTTNGFNVESSYNFQPQVIISGLSPVSGRAGTQVLISGINFRPEFLSAESYGESENKYLVNFNGGITGFKLTPDFRLSGFVPPLASTGPVTIFSSNQHVYYTTGQFKRLNDPMYIYTGDGVISPRAFWSGTTSGIYQILTITGTNMFNITGIRLSGVGTYRATTEAKYVRIGTGPFQWIYTNIFQTGNDNISKVYNIGSGFITGYLSGTQNVQIYNKFQSTQIKEDINGGKINVYLPVNLYSTNLLSAGQAGSGYGVYEIKVLGREYEQVISGVTGSFMFQPQYLRIRR